MSLETTANGVGISLCQNCRERPFTGDANLDSVKDVAWAEISLKTIMMSTTKPGSWEEEKRVANTLAIIAG